MPDKVHMTVVRDKGYKRSEFNTRGRHNERKNEEYGNGDIVPERIPLNVHFHQNLKPDGEPETYDETYSRLLAGRRISEKWQKPESAQFAEMVFDVNTEYFDERGDGSPGGGYEYAKAFFEEAYRFALKEIGSEEFVISAVLHADERHKTLSEQLGRDVFHYHLHVVYIPVVEKRDYYSKDYQKDPALAGTLRAVYMQVAHSKKWPIKVPVEREGKKFFINSYSLLQDRYFEHMRDAGFEGFIRGERGSTAEHLDVLDYKIQQDKARTAALDTEIKGKEETAAALDQRAERTQKQLDGMGKKLKVRQTAARTFGEIEGMAKQKMFGKVELAADDWDEVSKLAKKGVTAKADVIDLQRQLAGSRKDRDVYKERWEKLSKDTEDYRAAVQRNPERTEEALRSVPKEAPRTGAPRQPGRKHGGMEH